MVFGGLFDVFFFYEMVGYYMLMVKFLLRFIRLCLFLFFYGKYFVVICRFGICNLLNEFCGVGFCVCVF